MERDLIFDIGLHRGEDSELYLKKGFRVIGVEANRELCRDIEQRFPDEIRKGQLTIVNKAIAGCAGRVKFYVNITNSIWGTVNSEWAERNSRRGMDSEECEVEATTMETLIDEFGIPYYAKIDIEGSDLIAVEGFGKRVDKPKYISIEAEKDSFRGLRREIGLLSSLGYSKFNIVNQRFGVVRQHPPNPAKEGTFAAHIFQEGSSGLFGEELPGDWMTAEEAIEAYRPVFLRYALTGDDPFIRSGLIRNLLRVAGCRPSWYDTHARRELA